MSNHKNKEEKDPIDFKDFELCYKKSKKEKVKKSKKEKIKKEKKSKKLELVIDKKLWPEIPPTLKKATKGSSGYDLVSAVDAIIPSGGQLPIKTGIAIGIPHGYEGQVRPRSGLAAKHKISITNSPGTIDSDYTGWIVVLLENRSFSEFIVNRGDRIAQLVIQKVEDFEVVEVDSLTKTERGSGGFGSTGSH